MIRFLIPVLLAVAVLGCQGQDAQVPLDPFYGQTRIAPPGTGEIARRPAVDPYYPRSAAASPSAGNIQPPPMNDNPASARLASNTTAGNEKPAVTASGDRIAIPVSARRELSASEMLAARPSQMRTEPQRLADAGSSSAVSAGVPREPQQIVQTLSPREKSFGPPVHSSGVPASGATRSRRGPVDINDLPPVNRGAGTLRDDQVRQVSAVQADAGVTVRIPTQATAKDSRGRFGWADDYSRLRGQLEYLESDHCWKLRYIPVDKKTDDFGGSVLVADSESISGYERGDFVEVRGRITKEPEQGTDFAPVYEVTSIHGLDR
jgi:hypothetical protein